MPLTDVSGTDSEISLAILSVCPSETLCYCARTAKHFVEMFSLPDNPPKLTNATVFSETKSKVVIMKFRRDRPYNGCIKMIISLDELFSQLLAMRLRPTARRYDKSTRAIHDLTDLNLF